MENDAKRQLQKRSEDSETARKYETQMGDQWWRSGESTRLPPMWPGFDFQTRRHMWVEFVGSLLCSERFFPRVLKFSPLLKKPAFDSI